MSVEVFLSTLSLRRATNNFFNCRFNIIISIHALLAESDVRHQGYENFSCRFLSTLSLRRATVKLVSNSNITTNFYPRSPCGERLAANINRITSSHFYPRSPCGERRHRAAPTRPGWAFLSTLSLRRATNSIFHVRSFTSISIHALLAESDGCDILSIERCSLFLSTLSLRRATRPLCRRLHNNAFLSTLSLRRATRNGGRS